MAKITSDHWHQQFPRMSRAAFSPRILRCNSLAAIQGDTVAKKEALNDRSARTTV
jgi:hypothetical protein